MAGSVIFSITHTDSTGACFGERAGDYFWYPLYRRRNHDGAGGAGGAGGGGAGGRNTAGVAGAVNTGGGGGGGNNNTSTRLGGVGGSGIVIIAYKTDGSDGVSPDSTGGTVTTSGGNTIHTFTSSGTFTVVESVSPAQTARRGVVMMM